VDGALSSSEFQNHFIFCQMYTITMHIKFWQQQCNVPIMTYVRTLHPGGIRTRDLLYCGRTRWPLCHKKWIRKIFLLSRICSYRDRLQRPVLETKLCFRTCKAWPKLAHWRNVLKMFSIHNRPSLGKAAFKLRATPQLNFSKNRAQGSILLWSPLLGEIIFCVKIAAFSIKNYFIRVCDKNIFKSVSYV
jgi:hypothetical protein